MYFKLTETQKFLCLCIRHIDFVDIDQVKFLYRKIGDQTIYKESKLNGVQSIVAHVLLSIFHDSEIPSHWLDEYNDVDKKISNYMHELEKVATLLKSINIDLLALKNSGIALGLYKHYGACPMGDVDVLVRKSDFRKAHRCLVNNGYLLKFRNPLEEDNIHEAEKSGGAEYSVILEDNSHLWFELQWRPVAGRWIQPSQEPKSSDLMDNSKSIYGSNVKILSPEDNLIQVALHTAKHSYVRAPGFRLHTDVDRIVSSENINWDLFVSKVIALKIKTAVYISLAMPAFLMKTPIPESVLLQLRPNRLKIYIMNLWLEKVSIFEPDAPKWGRVSYIFFVSLLYDNFFDFIRGIFPDIAEIKNEYDFSSNFLIPWFYFKRILNLVFKRLKT